MNHIKSYPFLFLFVMLLSPCFGQTFTYVDEFILPEEETDDIDDMCIAVDDDKLYVIDADDQGVDIYSAISPYGFQQQIAPQINDPGNGIIIVNGLIFVADDSDAMIHIYNKSNNMHIQTLELQDNYENVSSINGLALDFNRLFVPNSGRDVLVLDGVNPYDSITRFGDPYLVNPSGIITYGSNIFVGDDSDEGIEIFDGNSYTHVGQIGTGLTFSDGMAIVCDYLLAIERENNEVYVYSAVEPFEFITSFGGSDLTNPACIAAFGNLIYVLNNEDDETVFIYELEEGCAAIPTISQWGTMTIIILLLIIGVLSIQSIKIANNNTNIISLLVRK